MSGPGVDDYALSRVPLSERHGWWSVGMQRFGQISALSQFLLGATLGFGMTFWSAFWALTLGAGVSYTEREPAAQGLQPQPVRD